MCVFQLFWYFAIAQVLGESCRLRSLECWHLSLWLVWKNNETICDLMFNVSRCCKKYLKLRRCCKSTPCQTWQRIAIVFLIDWQHFEKGSWHLFNFSSWCYAKKCSLKCSLAGADKSTSCLGAAKALYDKRDMQLTLWFKIGRSSHGWKKTASMIKNKSIAYVEWQTHLRPPQLQF